MEPFADSVKELQARRLIANSLENSHIVKNLELEVFSLFPAYKNKEMHMYNYAVQKRSVNLDAGFLSEKLLEKLERCENFTLKRNSEVNLIRSSKGIIKSLSIVGKSFEEIKADAVVLCTGAHTARILYGTLGVFAPLMPIKSYTFDLPT